MQETLIKQDIIQGLLAIILGGSELGAKQKAYEELVSLSHYKDLPIPRNIDFMIHIPNIGMRTQLNVINGGYYLDFSNLLGFSHYTKRDDLDTCQLKKGILAYIDCKLIPMIEDDLYLEDSENQGYYHQLMQEFHLLNIKYLEDDPSIQQQLQVVGQLNERLSQYKTA